jgi:hypothetical protein
MVSFNYPRMYPAICAGKLSARIATLSTAILRATRQAF